MCFACGSTGALVGGVFAGGAFAFVLVAGCFVAGVGLFVFVAGCFVAGAALRVGAVRGSRAGSSFVTGMRARCTSPPALPSRKRLCMCGRCSVGIASIDSCIIRSMAVSRLIRSRITGSDNMRMCMSIIAESCIIPGIARLVSDIA